MAENQAAEGNVTINTPLDQTVEMKEFNFRFKKDKLGNQRAAVKLMAPVPSVSGVIQVLEKGDKKQWELLQDALYDVVRGVLADQVANKEDISQENLDLGKLTWEAIANMPKEDRRSAQIPQETWDDFVKDYIEVMPGLTKKSVEAVTNATQVYVRKFAPWKSQKNVISKLKDQLALYVGTPNAEQYSEIIDLLMRRADTYLSADNLEAVAQNL